MPEPTATPLQATAAAACLSNQTGRSAFFHHHVACPPGTSLLVCGEVCQRRKEALFQCVQKVHSSPGATSACAHPTGNCHIRKCRPCPNCLPKCLSPGHLVEKGVNHNMPCEGRRRRKEPRENVQVRKMKNEYLKG